MIQVESSSFAFINWPKQLENPLHHKATKKSKKKSIHVRRKCPNLKHTPQTAKLSYTSLGKLKVKVCSQMYSSCNACSWGSGSDEPHWGLYNKAGRNKAQWHSDSSPDAEHPAWQGSPRCPQWHAGWCSAADPQGSHPAPPGLPAVLPGRWCSV